MNVNVGTLAKAVLLLAVMALPVAARDSASEAKRVLDSTRVSVDFKESPLENAIAFLREQTGLNFHLGSDHTDAKVTMKLKDVSARTVLKYALKPHDLSAAWREGVIVIESRGRAGVKMVMRVYDVRNQAVPLEDHPGQEIELASNGMGVHFLTTSDATSNWIDPALTADYIQKFTGNGSWDGASGASITNANGLLIVKQTPAVHKEIMKLLRLLEQYR